MRTKLLTSVLAVAALALPATALAMQCAPTRTGDQYTSRTATGSCSVTRGSDTATLRCSGTGAASARYTFKLKDGCGPSVVPWVDAQVGIPAVGSRQHDGIVTVWVRATGQSRIVVSTVSLRYYCK
jgi:hypothetical protein